MNTRVAFGVIVAAALGACSSSHPLGGGASGQAGAGAPGITFYESINRNVDVLFMLDNSTNMTEYQQKLAISFQAYVDVLAALPGGLPNLHIGIVSSSLGAGRNPSIDHCPPGGDQGILQTSPRGTSCAMGVLDAGASYIINNDGQTNYKGELADVFGCIAMLGSQGCGFEHQLASVLRALGADGAPAPTKNAGFLRPDAFLQIILVSDEDDCSAPPSSDLFDSSSMLVSDPLGPIQSYRCNEFGHLCNGKPPPRTPINPPVDLSGTCVSAEDGRLLRVADVVTALKRLKADPSKVMVAALAGPPNPYVVDVAPQQIKTDPSMWPYVKWSCMAPDGSIADPGVRINQWVQAFGSNGLFQGACNDSFAPALTAMAQQIGQKLGAPCLDVGLDPNTCSAVEHVANPQTGNLDSTPLARCSSNGDQPPCWYVGPSASCASGNLVRVMRSGPVVDASVTVTCEKGSP
jgi:hypothetical protein